MSTIFEIPLTAQPQTFHITLSGVEYALRLHWCDPADCWVMDVSDSNDVPILSSVPLVTANNLLEQFGYLGLGGQLLCQTDGDASAVPAFENLGSSSHLFWVVP